MWKAFLGMLDTVAKVNEKRDQSIFVKDFFNIYFHDLYDYRRGLDWWMDFFNHLYTPLGITSNYSAIADIHTLQITTR
jgi:hypothetical protein